jgi:hypothetical protein
MPFYTRRNQFWELGYNCSGGFLRFQEKEAKGFVLLCRKAIYAPNLGEAGRGGGLELAQNLFGLVQLRVTSIHIRGILSGS